MSKLVDGKIPQGIKCPWVSQCEIAKGGACHHKGEEHLCDFSCASARAFDLIESLKNNAS